MYELATVKPHVRDDARFDNTTWPAYRDGYYMAIMAAVKVMHLALERRRSRQRIQRQIAAEAP